MMIRSLAFAILLVFPTAVTHAQITGAWKTTGDDGASGAMIVTDQHISIAWYQTDPAEFLYTKGGTWSRDGDSIEITYEFHTKTPDMVGQSRSLDAELSGDQLVLGSSTWTRVDDGAPGDLEGSWLMTGRKRDGEISTRRPGVRRTMKILSGTRFQWIAFNVETREFFGTGGGTYTTVDGAYTENIEFFSRDDSKAGLSLGFQYDLPDGVWHHQGHSTKGDPMYEIWERRSDLGI